MTKWDTLMWDPPYIGIYDISYIIYGDGPEPMIGQVPRVFFRE